MSEPSLLVRRLGRQPYRPVWSAMRAFTDARDADTPDELWMLQHDPVFTLGQAGRMEHVLAPGGIPVIAVERGGQVTYHGPGQIVGYPLLDLRRLGLGIRELVVRIEQAMIDTLAEWNIEGRRREGAPGVYVAGAKIGAQHRVRAFVIGTGGRHEPHPHGHVSPAGRDAHVQRAGH